jgi:hypothetical protein
LAGDVLPCAPPDAVLSGAAGGVRPGAASAGAAAPARTTASASAIALRATGTSLIVGAGAAGGERGTGSGTDPESSGEARVQVRSPQAEQRVVNMPWRKFGYAVSVSAVDDAYRFPAASMRVGMVFGVGKWSVYCCRD